jgi:hypothetical protein
MNFLQPVPVGIAETINDTTYLYQLENQGIPLIKTSYSYNYLGEIDAKEKTVGNITTEFLNKSPPVNILGDNYNDKDISWFIIDTTSISTNKDSNNLKIDNPRSLPDYCIPNGFKGEPIDNSQDILYSFYDTNLSSNNINNSVNITENLNTTSDNKTNASSADHIIDNNTKNQSSYGLENKANYIGSYTLIPRMIATVQDTTFLYIAVAFFTFFWVLFSLSTWRFLVNKKQSL